MTDVSSRRNPELSVELDDYLNLPRQEVALRAGLVLVVDDSPTTLKVVERVLASIGITNCISVSSASDAFSILHSHKVDLVIADVEMAPLSGLQLLSAIRTHPDMATTPVLLMTASYNSAHLGNAKSLGASGYLLKPFSADGLKTAILNVCEMPVAAGGPETSFERAPKKAAAVVERWTSKRER
jgi:two-component system, chemotaxis family, chemotaxis protein CheY